MIYGPAEAALDGLYRMRESFFDTARPGYYAILDARHLVDDVILEAGDPLANMGDSSTHAGSEGRGEAVAAVYPGEE